MIILTRWNSTYVMLENIDMFLEVWPSVIETTIIIHQMIDGKRLRRCMSIFYPFLINTLCKFGKLNDCCGKMTKVMI
ncbi:hypothetical protein CR513_32918, partial [Mucuna pruriens]